MAQQGVDARATRRRRIGCAALALGCGTGVFLLMANEAQLPHAAAYGALLLLAGVLALFAALGLLTPEEGSLALSQTSFAALPGEPRWAAPSRTVPLSALVLVGLTAALGAHRLPIVVCLALALLLASAVRRPLLLTFVLASALYLPMLGAYGLWDPWETHYGEVTREMLSRDDWISLWWAQDKWFWSKPILIFWSEALTFSASGLAFRPDSNPQHTEWVLRLPIFAMAVTALCAVHLVIARYFSRRAGVVCALVLATTPYYAFLTHQAITDMPFVANMTVAMALLMVGLIEDPETRARSVRIGNVALSAQHALIALLLCVGLPQVLYLASRNLSFVDYHLFHWHRDAFTFGSGGNPDVPGNFGLRDELPRVRALALQPLGQALVWLGGLAGVVFMAARQTRVQALAMFGFYAFCALAFMGKGIPGFALPGLLALLCLVALGRFDRLFSGQLYVAAGVLTVVVLGMPWFVASYVRHGAAFTDRILVHDHLNRLTSGVHGDNGTIQYFIWQLGYGVFPWVALLPAALGAWLPGGPSPSDRERAQRAVLLSLGLWFASSFTLFSAMTTKFHHYIFPAVPAAALLVGLVLDRMLGDAPLATDGRGVRAVFAALAAPILLVLGVAGARGDVRGIVPPNLGRAESATWVLAHGMPVWLALLFVLAGLALLVHAYRQLAGTQAQGTGGIGLPAAVLAGAVVVAFVGRDLSWHTKEPPPGSERLIHLFVYNYGRPWPEHLDYRPIFTGFAVVATLLTAALALRALRKAAALSSLSLAGAFTLFCLDVYMIDLTPHWSQQALVQRYYALRTSRDEALVAWQMNWKGENYYTGNRVAVFVDLDNKKIQEWIKQHKGKRAFFVLEHSRYDRFKRLLAPRKVTAHSTPRENNKFLLVSAPL